VSDLGRRLRVAATATVAVLLLAGTLVGSDVWFPVGPFRMFATAARTTGRVTAAELTGVTADGRTLAVRPGEVGLRRAELEGRLPQLRAEPALLGELVGTYERLWVEAPRLVELRIDVRTRAVVDRRLQASEDVRTVARWTR